MILSSLDLRNFRNHKKRSITFAPQITLLVGANAAGKTNILEAITMMATGKSFRAGQDRETIYWGEELASIVAKGTPDIDLQLMVTAGEVQGKKAPLKKLMVNGVSRRIIDFVGNLRAVLFWPKDLELVTDSPSVRRKYLDNILIQVDRNYRRNLLSYERGIRQRNKLLDRIAEGLASRTQLLFWDQLLIKCGGELTDTRAAFIDYVNQTKFAKHTFGIEYDKSVISQARLEQYKLEEVAAKSTLVGPHRDDYRFMSHEHSPARSDGLRNLGTYGSRGEQRLAVLWFKLAELSYMEHVTGSRPILLLDDIFSELDKEHRFLIGDVITKQQTIITSAHEQAVPTSIAANATMLRV